MMDVRNGLLVGGMAVLAAVAVVGWTRKATSASADSPQQSIYVPSASANGSPANTTPANTYLGPNNGDLNSRDLNSQPPLGQPVYATSNNGVPCLGSAGGYQSAVYSPGNGFTNDGYVRTTHRPIRIVRNEPVRTEYVQESGGSRQTIYSRHHPRSGKKSAAIVAGTAGAGAAIGAIAGGGKGAGLGALSGGAAGFIYDRLTHNK